MPDCVQGRAGQVLVTATMATVVAAGGAIGLRLYGLPGAVWAGSVAWYFTHHVFASAAQLVDAAAADLRETEQALGLTFEASVKFAATVGVGRIAALRYSAAHLARAFVVAARVVGDECAREAALVLLADLGADAVTDRTEDAFEQAQRGLSLLASAIWGRLRAVTATDVLSLLAQIVGQRAWVVILPFWAAVYLYSSGGIHEVVTNLDQLAVLVSVGGGMSRVRALRRRVKRPRSG